MVLDQKDLELIEKLVYKNGDDIAVSIARSFERIEDRIDAAESRIYMRLGDIEDKLHGTREEVAHELHDVKSVIGELMRMREVSISEFALAE